MTESDRVTRNRAMLAQCHPVFRSALVAVLLALQGRGFRPRIQCAWRSPADEDAAYRAGHSHVEFGFHNVTGADGTPQALAADVLDDDQPLTPTRGYLLALTRAAHAQQLETGLAWGLPPNIRVALEQALAGGSPYDGRIGWDPEHVQIAGLTIVEAQAGQRPPGGPTKELPPTTV